jgi:hypothetical protein
MRVAARLFSCWLLVTVGGGVASRLFSPAPVPLARAEGSWKDELEHVCARTDDAMSLTSDELRSLVSRCDALKPSIAKLDESERKVYSKRLQLCRDLYAFMLETRER